MRIFGFAVSCAIVFANSAFYPALGLSDLDSKISSVLPTAREDEWLRIGWRTNLMQARLEAQRLHRPLFLWIMNGNPMGCT